MNKLKGETNKKERDFVTQKKTEKIRYT